MPRLTTVTRPLPQSSAQVLTLTCTRSLVRGLEMLECVDFGKVAGSDVDHGVHVCARARVNVWAGSLYCTARPQGTYAHAYTCAHTCTRTLTPIRAHTYISTNKARACFMRLVLDCGTLNGVAWIQSEKPETKY